MADTVGRYLARRADLNRWPLSPPPPRPPRAVVVIPCLAERDHLPHTLGDLAAQPPVARGEVLVLCVVNNRAPEPSGPHRGAAEASRLHADIENNLETLAWLGQMRATGADWLRVLDAASPGHELPPKGGVGLARKIGLDAGLAVMRGRAQGGVLVCLDADTRVDPSYLERILHFHAAPRWAAILNYAHPITASPEGEAIVCYELFLRHHELGLRHAGSPYAFHSIGSTITCTGDAYAAVSGMNQRQAGEDFYFLQEVAKTGPVERIPGPPVVPAARPSHRVPFGTGRRVLRHLAGGQDEYLVYDPRSYEILGRFLGGVERDIEQSAQVLLAHAQEAAPPLAAFLNAQGFEQAWERIARHTQGRERLTRQFHRWFDGFKTLKAMHFLRDNGYPMCEMFAGIASLLDDPHAHGRDQAAALLTRLREVTDTP